MRRMFILIACLFSCALQAGVGEDLRKFFDKSGVLSNSSKSRAVQLQASGHYSGGSFTARNAVRPLPKPIHLEPPHLTAGCGGIDVHFGSFSHISGKELEEFFKATVSNAVGYTAMMFLEETMPQVAGIQKTLKSITDLATLRNMNSCALATQAGEYGRRILTGQNACGQKASSGRSDDFEASNKKCATSQKERDKFAEKNPDDTSLGDKNLAWMAIKKSPSFQSDGGRLDRDLGEFAMSLTGTVIVKKASSSKEKGEKEGPRFETKHFPSKMDDNFLASFFEGTEVRDKEGKTQEREPCKRYRCDNVEGCLVVKEVQSHWSEKDSWKGRVKGLILSIQEKIESGNSDFAPSETALIEKSHIPISKALNVMSAMREVDKISPFNEEVLADVISYDVFIKYIGEIVQELRSSVQTLQKHQSDDTALKDFLKEIDRVEKRILAEKRDFNKRMMRDQTFMRELDHYENVIFEKIRV